MLEGKPLLLAEAPFPEQTTFAVHAHASSRRSHQGVVTTETPAVLVQATNCGSSSYNYALAVVATDGRGQQTVQMADAEWFVPKRYVKSLSAQYAPSDSGSAGPDVDYKTARNLLGEAFGTKKQRTAISSAEHNQINTAALKASSAGYIRQAIAALDDPDAVTPPESRSESPVVEGGGLLPRHDADTPNVDAVFAFEDLVPTAVLASLPVDSFSGSEETYREAVGYLAPHIAQRMDAARGNVRSIALVLFLHYMVSFRGLREAQLNSHAALQEAFFGCHDVPAMSAFFLGTFAEHAVMSATGGGKTRYKQPGTHKDRLVLWIIVTVLLLDNYRTSLTALSVQLQIGPTKMASYFRSAGCLLERPARGEPPSMMTPDGRALPNKWARLRAPLCLPKPSLGKRK